MKTVRRVKKYNVTLYISWFNSTIIDSVQEYLEPLPRIIHIKSLDNQNSHSFEMYKQRNHSDSSNYKLKVYKWKKQFLHKMCGLVEKLVLINGVCMKLDDARKPRGEEVRKKTLDYWRIVRARNCSYVLRNYSAMTISLTKCEK